MPKDLRGTVTGDFQLHQRLAMGGSCEIYLAKHRIKDLWAAIKIVREGIDNVKVYARQLEAEFEMLSSIKHKSVPRVLNIERIEDRMSMTMQLGPEVTLSQVMNRPTAVNWRSIWQRILEVTAYLHSNDIIHNDLKPENILMYPDNRILLIDFGLARRTDVNIISRMFMKKRATHGTTGYLAPEVLAGKSTSTQSDVYSMSIIAFRLLEAARGNSTTSFFRTKASVKQHDLEPGSFDEFNELSRTEKDFLNACLETNPKNRPASAFQLYRAFREENRQVATRQMVRSR